MKSEWFFKIMGQEFGPHSSAEMKHFAIMGRITPGTLVRKGRDGKWTDAAKVQGLLDSQSAANKTPPPVVSPASLTPPPIPSVPANNSKRRKMVLSFAVGLGVSLVAVALIAVKYFRPVLPPLCRTNKSYRNQKSQSRILRGFSSGTGFLVSDGLLATNRHVLATEFIEDLEIEFPSAGVAARGPFKATLVYDDPKRDLAFLKVDTKLKPLPIADDFAFQKGQDVIVIGSPGAADVSLENAVSKGVVSTEITIGGETYRQLGISINPGNSGGPVLHSSGSVIGIVTLKAKEQEGLAFCIPFNELRRINDGRSTNQ